MERMCPPGLLEKSCLAHPVIMKVARSIVASVNVDLRALFIYSFSGTLIMSGNIGYVPAGIDYMVGHRDHKRAGMGFIGKIGGK